MPSSFNGYDVKGHSSIPFSDSLQLSPTFSYGPA